MYCALKAFCDQVTGNNFNVNVIFASENYSKSNKFPRFAAVLNTVH